jgi:hypothetical protein
MSDTNQLPIEFMANELDAKQEKLVELLTPFVGEPDEYGKLSALNQVALRIARDWNPTVQVNSKGDIEIVVPDA